MSTPKVVKFSDLEIGDTYFYPGKEHSPILLKKKVGADRTVYVGNHVEFIEGNFEVIPATVKGDKIVYSS